MPQKKLAVRLALVAVSVLLALNAVGCCKRKVKIITAQADTYREAMHEEKITEKSQSEPTKLMKSTGLNFSIAPSAPVQPISIAPAGMSFFQDHYRKGVALMEAGDYIKAIEVFKAIISQYPDSEEASVSHLCLADMYFALQNDKKAIEHYEIIIAKFPLTPAAENAKAAIQYLKDFKKYEKGHIPVDKYDVNGGRRR